jgi:hypothetical protein
MTFGDRRVADGLQMPFRITTTSEQDRLVDDITFETVRVNGNLSSSDFRVTSGQ